MNNNDNGGCSGGDCGSGQCGTTQPQQPDVSQEQFMKEMKLQENIQRIKHKILVLSGKGGVGKSMVALRLAALLVSQGKKVGLLDIDVHGPSVPTLLGLEGQSLGIDASNESLKPIEHHGMKVISLGFLLKNQDDAVIWRGPLKMGVIRQFLQDVEWGDLDYLVVDAPPGTGDEPLSIAQLLPDAHAILVSTPQKLATTDVRKSVSFCRKVNIDLLGIVENMSGLTCPECNKLIEIYPGGEAAKMAEEMNVPLLASLPIDPKLAKASDDGDAYNYVIRNYSNGDVFEPVLDKVLALDDGASDEAEAPASEAKEDKEEAPAGDKLLIAVPVVGGKLSGHFGHPEVFAFITVDKDAKKILDRDDREPPGHEPGVLPKWIAAQGANVILAGGMGGMAENLLKEAGIEVMLGCPEEDPEKLVGDYLAGTLTTSSNTCDH